MNSHITRKEWEKTGIQKLWISYGWDYEFAKLRVMRAMRTSVVSVPMCQKRAHFPLLNTDVQINVPKCQSRANYSTCRAKMSKACQIFNLAFQRAKGVLIIKLGVPIFQLRLPRSVPIFQIFFKRKFLFLNVSIMRNIWRFQEYFGNYRKFISRNKEFEFWH